MEGGALLVLDQPAEFVIIGGAALGTLLIGTPMPLLKRIAGVPRVFFKAARASRTISRCWGCCISCSG